MSSARPAESHAASSSQMNGGYLAEPHDLDEIIDRLHIGTLQREKLRARRSILVDEDAPPLSSYEADVLSKSETYSVTSEESYGERRPGRRKPNSASSRDSGLGKDASPKASGKTSDRKKPPSTDKEVQTTIGKGFQYSQLKDVYAAEEGKLQHAAAEEKPSGKSKVLKLLKLSRKASPTPPTDGNQNSLPDNYPSLPQVFIVKYMGKRPAKGYGGAKYTQGPVEEVIEAVNQLPKGSDLPLVKLEVSLEGLSMTPHKRNKVKSFESVSIPIKFISYGSQDQNYPRVFSFIMVKEMSARSKKLDCHVYASDSSKNARKLAGLLAIAFQVYQEKMDGHVANFSTPVHPDPNYLDDTKSSYEV